MTYQPPTAARRAARQVLGWRRRYGAEVRGMTEIGWRRARQLAAGRPVSRATVAAMSQFARHGRNAAVAARHRSTPWRDAGRVAWLGWGGDAGIAWAQRTMARIRRKNPVWLSTDPPRQAMVRLVPGAGPKLDQYPGDLKEEARQSYLRRIMFPADIERGAYDFESEKAARRRRKEEGPAESEGDAEIRQLRGGTVRPVSMLTKIKRLGGIAWSSWGDPRTRTYPGETSKDYRKSLPGVFRAKGARGGMKWDELARSLAADGYGPTTDAGELDTGAVEAWFVETLDSGDPRQEFPGRGAGAEDYLLRREAAERWRQAKEQREAEKMPRRRANPLNLTFTLPLRFNGRRRANPSLMTLTNPVPSDALAAYRKFHRRAPTGVRKLGGKGPALVALGDLVEIVYKPTKGARRGPAFVHKFNAGAVLAATPDGRELVLLPSPRKPFRVDWERGIVG